MPAPTMTTHSSCHVGIQSLGNQEPGAQKALSGGLFREALLERWSFRGAKELGIACFNTKRGEEEPKERAVVLRSMQLGQLFGYSMFL